MLNRVRQNREYFKLILNMLLNYIVELLNSINQTESLALID
jgi:hypothetical protein